MLRTVGCSDQTRAERLKRSSIQAADVERARMQSGLMKYTRERKVLLIIIERAFAKRAIDLARINEIFVQTFAFLLMSLHGVCVCV